MYIVFDIGGTNTRLAKSRDGNTLDQVIKFSTPPKFEDGVELITKKITELVSDQKIFGIAGGIPGPLSKDRKIRIHSGYLSDWENKPIKNLLEERFNSDVILYNDAEVAALGEANQGAGKNFDSMIYLTIGTGIGGCWVKNKKIVADQYSFEPGHQIIDINSHKSLGQLADGTFLAEYFSQPLDQVPKQELWDSIKDALLVGLYNTYLHWPSEVIILGGGVTLKIDIPIQQLKSELHKMLTPKEELPEIAIAELGDEAGLYGSLSLIK